MNIAELWIMGVRVRFGSADHDLLCAVTDSLAAWVGAGAGPESGSRTLDVRLVATRGGGLADTEVEDVRREDGRDTGDLFCRGIEDGGGAGDADRRDMNVATEPRIEVDGPFLRLAGVAASGSADARTGRGTCIVSDRLIEDPVRLAADVLDPILLFLLTRAGRVPLHAAGVLFGETAAVLAGPSGTGKSTLALAALGAGLPILSDDAVYLQLAPIFRVWGFPRPIRVLGGSPAGVAEVKGAPRWTESRSPAREAGTSVRGGRAKVVRAPSAEEYALGARRGALCLLVRGSEAAIRPISAGHALDRLLAAIDPGFDHFLEHLPPAVEALAAGGCWELTLSPDLDRVLEILRRTLATSAETSIPMGRSRTNG